MIEMKSRNLVSCVAKMQRSRKWPVVSAFVLSRWGSFQYAAECGVYVDSRGWALPFIEGGRLSHHVEHVDGSYLDRAGRPYVVVPVYSQSLPTA